MKKTKKGKVSPKKKGMPLKKSAAPKRGKKAAVKGRTGRAKPIKKAGKAQPAKRAKKSQPGIVSFSETQLAIIRMICDQLTSKEIAKKLNFTKRTIEDYRSIIQEKMEVMNVAGMVVYAIKHGIYVVK